MANTRRSSRRANRKNVVSRKNRRVSRKNVVSRKNRRANRKNAMSRRANRKNMMGGRRRRNTRRVVKGGAKGIVSRVYRPVGALGTGAGKTLTTAATAAVNVFNTGVHGIDKTLKTAAGTINDTVSKIFSRRRRAERRTKH